MREDPVGQVLKQLVGYPAGQLENLQGVISVLILIIEAMRPLVFRIRHQGTTRLGNQFVETDHAHGFAILHVDNDLMDTPFAGCGLELPRLTWDLVQRGSKQIESASILFDLFVAFVLVHCDSFSSKPFSTIQVAICTRESNPSLSRMRVT